MQQQQQQITTIWFVFRIKEGDILNCCLATLNRESARQRLIDVAENDIDDDAVWYRLHKYHYQGLLNVGQTIHIVVRAEEINFYSLNIEGVTDQYALIPSHIRDNDDDFWIDNVNISG